MRFGLEQMKAVIDKISQYQLKHRDCVIVGDNSSGKSFLIKMFVQKEKNKQIYFIDAVNRFFDVTKVSDNKRPDYRLDILKTRLDEEHFNLLDSFNCYGTHTERVEMIYRCYEDTLQDLFSQLTGERFRIIEDSPLGEVDFGNGRAQLSSGYQAIVRILLELVYYQDAQVTDTKDNRAWVVIDEIDEFLSPKYSAKILEFLKKVFPWADWIVTTHSCDLVAFLRNANLILLDGGHIEVTDIDDYSSISEVQLVFEHLYGRITPKETGVDNVLRRLFNNKMSDAWSPQDQQDFENLKGEKLTTSQLLILRQIQEW